MKDPRYKKLADLLVNHSCEVNPGEKVFIEVFDIPPDFTTSLISAVVEKGGLPLVVAHHEQIRRALQHSASADQLKLMAEVDLLRMKNVQCYMGIRGSHNIAEFSDVPRERVDLYEKLYMHPVHLEQRVKHTKWVVLRWPHAAMAQSAGMSTEAFEDFYFRVCAGVDYGGMQKAMEPLVDLMNRTDHVQIIAPNTDLRFSIKGIGAVPCSGQRNIPDGECFSCPVKDSVNGHIAFNCETLYRGTVFNNIRLTFHNGKVTTATADTPANTQKLNEVLDSDAGARYIGEFSLAFNPYILKPMRDILFDEKIAGSFHFTPGQAYEEADNGNRSQVHWDMVLIQRPDYGGGSISFDGKEIRKDGLFTDERLKGLNPDALGSE